MVSGFRLGEDDAKVAEGAEFIEVEVATGDRL